MCLRWLFSAVFSVFSCFLKPFLPQKNKKKAFFFSNLSCQKEKRLFRSFLYDCKSNDFCCKKPRGFLRFLFQKTVVMISYSARLSMIFSNVFRKFFNPFASFCMLSSYARAQGRTRVYLLIHALNRFTKSYKNNRRLFRLGY